MKKKRISFSLLSMFGIGAIIGFAILIVSGLYKRLFEINTMTIDMEWVLYLLLAILLIMAVRVTLLWVQSTGRTSRFEVEY